MPRNEGKRRCRKSLARAPHRGAGALAALVLASAALAIAPASAGAAEPTPTPECEEGTCTLTFSMVEEAQTWEVPEGVTEGMFVVKGAGGGGETNPLSGDLGGAGGKLTATYPLSEGATLTVVVGGAGENVTGAKFGGFGGFAGGARGGSGSGGGGGAGGGGGSFVFANGSLMLAAAGGGGGAAALADGGSGGVSGQKGSENGAPGGGGASASGPGSEGGMGAGKGKGPTSSQAIEGAGGEGSGGFHGAGGGGGGYYGGGGGGVNGTGDAGGGGGSDFHAEGGTGVVAVDGGGGVGGGEFVELEEDITVMPGDGSVTITYAEPEEEAEEKEASEEPEEPEEHEEPTQKQEHEEAEEHESESSSSGSGSGSSQSTSGNGSPTAVAATAPHDDGHADRRGPYAKLLNKAPPALINSRRLRARVKCAIGPCRLSALASVTLPDRPTMLLGADSELIKGGHVGSLSLRVPPSLRHVVRTYLRRHPHYRPQIELELSVMDGTNVIETARETLPIWTYPHFR